MDSTMNFGGTQPKIARNYRHGWAPAGIGTELQRNDHYLLYYLWFDSIATSINATLRLHRRPCTALAIG